MNSSHFVPIKYFPLLPHDLIVPIVELRCCLNICSEAIIFTAIVASPPNMTFVIEMIITKRISEELIHVISWSADTPCGYTFSYRIVDLSLNYNTITLEFIFASLCLGVV